MEIDLEKLKEVKPTHFLKNPIPSACSKLFPQENVEIKNKFQDLIKNQIEAASTKLNHSNSPTQYTVLLTGGTGFIGKEFLLQAVENQQIKKIFALIRQKKIRDKQADFRILKGRERGLALLENLLIPKKFWSKFEFLEGDIRLPDFGLSVVDLQRLEAQVTHQIHCAADVSFDLDFERSYRNNVVSNRNALALALRLQNSERSPFILHIGIGTAYICGRTRDVKENDWKVPREGFRNYYEVTKAMVYHDFRSYVLHKGLRAIELQPSIVLGRGRSGANHGDFRTAHAPCTLFGLLNDHFSETPLKTYVARALLANFPADLFSELNFVPVDRVAKAMIHSLSRPEAIGQSIFLTSENRLSMEKIYRIWNEEFGLKIKKMPVRLCRVLHWISTLLGLGRVKSRPLKSFYQTLYMKRVLCDYTEGVQPKFHGKAAQDLLGLPPDECPSEDLFRLACRYIFYVLGCGKVSDLKEISRRTAVWETGVSRLESTSGEKICRMSREQFKQQLSEFVDLDSFDMKDMESSQLYHARI